MGVMSSAFTLSKMLDNFNVDIAILSEHKLLPQSKGFLDSVNNNYSSYVKTDSSIDPYKSFSRGKGGICAYMPAENNLTYYSDTFSELQTRLEIYLGRGKVIVAGDLNAQVSWPVNDTALSGSISKSQILTQMMHTYHLVPLELASFCTGPRYSFIPTKTMLDHILVDRSVERCAINCRVVSDGELVLTSDHLPIVATIGLREATSTEWDLQNEVSHRNDMIAWRKVTSDDISLYHNHIEIALDHALSNDDSPNGMSDRITNVYMPPHKARFRITSTTNI